MSVYNPNRWLLSAALATLLTGAALPAAHATDPGSIAQRVSTAGLDLRSSAGQEAFRHRVAVAALQVCQAAEDGNVLDDCAMQARRRVAPQVGAIIAAAESHGQPANMLASAAPVR